MTDENPGPSARSAAEIRLERARDEEGRRELKETQERLEEKKRELAELEVEIARHIANHPHVDATALEVLDWVDHDSDALSELFRDVYGIEEGD